MPPSGRRGRGGRQAAQPQRSAAENEALETPSRKRRRVNGPAAAAQGSNAEDSQLERNTRSGSVETLTNEAPYDPLEVLGYPVDQCVTLMRSALAYPLNYRTTVSYVHNINDQPVENFNGFAMVAGRDWGYVIQQENVINGIPTVVIGRTDRAGEKRLDGGVAGVSPPAGQATSPSTPGLAADTRIDIDLSPERLVSRIHATIQYDPDKAAWFIHVSGRNGIKIDSLTVEREKTAELRSGMVIGVAGTQMLWVTPNDPVRVHKNWTQKIPHSFQDRDHEGSDGDDQDEPRSYGNQPPGPFGAGPPRPSNPPPPRPPPPPPQPSQPGEPPRSFKPAGNELSAALGSPAVRAQKQPATPREGSVKVKSSPAYSRGLMITGTGDVDYSLEEYKDCKPPHSYAQMIGQAIESTPEKMMTLANIYEYIKKHYSYYRFNGGGWQNSIRHNLSLSKNFERMPRKTEDPGKGSKWRICPDGREEFLKKGLYNTRKGPTRTGSSGPTSPALSLIKDQKPDIKENGAMLASERLSKAILAAEGGHDPFISAPDLKFKTSPRSPTPPLRSYPTANESFTPDRGPQPLSARKDATASRIRDLPIRTPSKPPAPKEPVSPVYGGFLPRPTPGRLLHLGESSDSVENTGLNDPANGSPVTLSQRYDTMNHFQTPMMHKRESFLAPPSTAHLPSQYLPPSSPAYGNTGMFFKFFNLSDGATPRRSDSSPIKWPGRDQAESPEKPRSAKRPREDDESGEDGAVQPSSPPVVLGDGIADVDMSPTRSRPVSRRDLAAVSQPTLAAEKSAVGLGVSTIEEEDDDQPIDLAKGFKKIGQFHSELSKNAVSLSFGALGHA